MAKQQLIKAILQGNTELLKAIVNQNPELLFLKTNNGVLTDAADKTYTLEEVEEMANKTGMLVFIPAEALTDEQIEEYLHFNQ